MIKSLSIRNYALIQELDLKPSEKLNIITGETGAGKSIMLGALGLLMGNRADTKVLWDEQTKCNVEGVFEISAYSLQSLFNELDLDYDNETIIRREISPGGKSRAFINDIPVTLDILKRVSVLLMDIHSQHESLQLGSNQYQLSIIDDYACHRDILIDYQIAFQHFQETKSLYESLLHKSTESAKEEDYKRFILKELEDADLIGLDQHKIENELNLLENAEEIKQKIVFTEQLLDGTDHSILNQIDDLNNLLRDLSRLSDEFSTFNERVKSVNIELKDIYQELTIKNEQLIYDPEKLESLKSRLSELFRLQQKHQVTSVEALHQIRIETEEELTTIDNLDEEIKKSEVALKNALDSVVKKGVLLSESRHKAAEKLSKQLTEVIHDIGIENGKVEIQLSAIDPSHTGLDTCAILFTANKGVAPKSLKDVASGGELSRLIFAIKYLIADKTALPTIIFDEIDTGVSGEIALKMIQMMKRMSMNHQVISISHLPQFAAGGNSHFFVYKDHSADKTVTKIKLLEEKERIEQIAKMIGGENPSTKAYDSARELLEIPN